MITNGYNDMDESTHMVSYFEFFYYAKKNYFQCIPVYVCINRICVCMYIYMHRCEYI